MPKTGVMCRDCFKFTQVDNSQISRECFSCFSNRLIIHPELSKLSIAHVDCDSFYASVEKRDNKNLSNKPIIVGGENRGVVAAACYVARRYGIRSAMPTYKAKILCPELIVIPPRMKYYQKIGREIRVLIESVTPAFQPISIDEAFLDLSGTETLHKCCPAVSMAKLQKKILNQIGISVSVGLAFNKSLAKLSSEQDKPNGYYVIGKREAREWLSEKPASIIFGLGKSTITKLNNIGIKTCSELVNSPKNLLFPILGKSTSKIIDLAKGIDNRPVLKFSEAKSISVETTFNKDIDHSESLLNNLHLLCIKLSTRLKKSETYGSTIILKLKRSDYSLITRSIKVDEPYQLAHNLFSIAETLLRKELLKKNKYRLIGIGITGLTKKEKLQKKLNLFGTEFDKKTKLENAFDKINNKIGSDTLIMGKHLKKKKN